MPDDTALYTSSPPQAASSRDETNDWLNEPLTPKQSAQFIHSGLHVIYKAIAAGELRAACINDRRDYRILRGWLIEWMQRRSRGPRPPKVYHPPKSKQAAAEGKPRGER